MAERNPIVHVVTIAQHGLRNSTCTDEEIVKYTMERLEFASAYRPDIANLPEIWNSSEPEEVPGPTTELLGKWARKKSCYVISPMYTRVGDLKFNSSVLIDRQGNVAGQYNKVRITEGGIKGGSCPGDRDVPVFKTDFGTIGMQICWDVAWPENWVILKGKGAQIVFLSSAYRATRQATGRALTHGYYVVSSTMGFESNIIDITGNIIDSSGQFRPWAQASLPLGKRLFEIDFHIEKTREIEKKYGRRVRIEWFHSDDWFTLASLDPDLTVDDIIKEFELVPLKKYHARAAAAQETAREKMKN